ncbi:hypothetical protein [Streptomyces sp. SP18BB07]|uniref:hypothetical protein n=1 Tax=Streptomyces sp. SP18BB07 TaxID=3002522 RepID=UPI002E797791|nr:hypothetical protein [Streptomyces sp. SP18BB07]MEE1761645.1 hypothetical protein [Streptomyces sp. SP18BB07]
MKRFGWTWLKGMARNTEFLRGSDSAGNRMAAGEKAIGLGGWVTPDVGNDPEAETVGMLPRTDDPFVAWGQREAIMRDARHPATAKAERTRRQMTLYIGEVGCPDAGPPGHPPRFREAVGESIRGPVRCGCRCPWRRLHHLARAGRSRPLASGRSAEAVLCPGAADWTAGPARARGRTGRRGVGDGEGTTARRADEPALARVTTLAVAVLIGAQWLASAAGLGVH